MRKGWKKFSVLILVAIFVIICNCSYAGEVKIAVIDSGAKKHVDYAKSFTSYEANKDPLRHGTKIAKLIRKGSPSAKIHMLQVCENVDGVLKPSRQAVLEAINWSVANNMDIVNMSLVTNFDKDIEQAIKDAATEHGILFIAASGNKKISSYFASDENGFMRKNTEVVKPAFPSSSPYVVSVGAYSSGNSIASYSSKFADISANGRYGKKKGTSFACARITAKAANVVQLQNARLDPGSILPLLK